MTKLIHLHRAAHFTSRLRNVLAASVLTLALPLTVAAGTYSLFSGAGVKEEILPERPDSHEPNHELGLYFVTKKAGYITAIRHWKSPSEKGEHVGRIWNTNGVELASATFTNETASGWQEVKLAKPLRIEANVKYVVSVNQNTHLPISCGSFAKILKRGGQLHENGPLQVWKPESLCQCEWNCADGVKANGPFSDSPGKLFPLRGGENSNYFRDIVFTDDTILERGHAAGLIDKQP